MFRILHIIESAKRTVVCTIKKLYWKIKYGKRIQIGRGMKFRKRLIINIEQNGQLIIKNNCFFNNDCSINCHKKIVIGHNNIFGENVRFYDHNHIFNNKKIDMNNSFSEKEIHIGNNNWIGSNAIILSKCKIGNNNVFGANTIINKEYGDDTITTIGDNQITKKIIYR